LKTYQQLENVLTSGDATCAEAILSTYAEIKLRDLAPQLQMFRRTRPVSCLEEATTALKEMIPEVRAEYLQVCQLVLGTSADCCWYRQPHLRKLNLASVPLGDVAADFDDGSPPQLCCSAQFSPAED